jgi:triphosphoribosyl-dephospho-CoA synthase
MAAPIPSQLSKLDICTPTADWSLGQLAELACVLEASAAKAGNVHPQHSFEDMTYVDFLNSAEALREAVERQVRRFGEISVGSVVYEIVVARAQVCRVNTNLGIALLLAPLIVAATQTDGWRNRTLTIENWRIALGRVLDSLSPADSAATYRAIRICRPGGLGEVQTMDVQAEPPEQLLDAMGEASCWDSIAAEYVQRFEKCFEIADWIRHEMVVERGWLERIVHVQLQCLAAWPDSLIVRKTDPKTGERVRQMGQQVVEGLLSFREFDTFLKSKGNQLNPGTTADLIAGGLFIAVTRMACEIC